jgi:signal transduction histidine kinase
MDVVGSVTDREGRRAERSVVAREVALFAASGLAAVALLGLAGVELLQRTGRGEAIRDAKKVSSLAAEGIVEPYIERGALSGNAVQRARLDRAVRRHVLTGGVVRVKIWSRDGRILYSDEPRLVGQRYRLGGAEQASIGNGKVDAEVSDLAKPENRFERRYDKLLEVYLPIVGPHGQPILFETYSRYSSVAASGRRLWLSFAPAILGTLFLLELAQVPLAWRLARRLRAGQEERETLLRRAIDASDVERRRVARDLHDGAVQSLAGVSYTLTAAAEHVDGEAAAVMREAAADTRRTIRELRTLLVDIYPPDLHKTGLAAALRDLLAPLPRRGIETSLELDDDAPSLPPELEQLLFRCAQEAVRNVVTHSHARRVEVKLDLNGGAALTVSDDGRGFDVDAASDGHFGLRLLRDLAHDAGGSVEIASDPSLGTTVRVEAPLP